MNQSPNRPTDCPQVVYICIYLSTRWRRASFDNHITNLPKPSMDGDTCLPPMVKALDPDTVWKMARENVKLALTNKKDFSTYLETAI